MQMTQASEKKKKLRKTTRGWKVGSQTGRGEGKDRRR